MLFEFSHHRRHRRRFLADRYIDTFNAGAFLIDNRIDRDRCFANLPVADDQLSLAATNRHHSVNRLESDLNRLINRLSCDNAGSDLLNRVGHLRLNRTLAIDWITQGVDHTALKLGPNGHL